MAQDSIPEIYDTIGRQYRHQRWPDPRIAAQINRAIGDAKRICNVGAGAGSYEPTGKDVIAVEPSQTMIDQRENGYPVVRATAEQLPFDDKSFDVAMTCLSIHHWKDPWQGLLEMKRIAKRQVVFTFDPERVGDLWMVADYLPEIIEFERERAPSVETITRCLDRCRVEPVSIPWDCTDGFQAAYWRRPRHYLAPRVRASISSFAQLPAECVDAAMARLRKDIESGEWRRRHASLLDQPSGDFGYRLIITE